MSSTKEIIRHRTLDKCFRNIGKRYFISDLMNACKEAIENYFGNSDGAERTTIYKDIKFMMSEDGYSAPIEKSKNGRDVYYFYSDRNFTINKQALSVEEAKEFREALKTLNRFKGLPQFDWMESISTRLEATFQLGNEADHIIEFDQNQLANGSQFIKPLYHAILYNQVISVTYQNFTDTKPNLNLLHPYYLKQYNHRWYILGLNPGSEKITRSALDRIASIEFEDKKFIPVDIDFKNYFKNMIGVSNDDEGQPENVLIRVYKVVWGWVRTKPLHHSQQVFRETETFVEIKLHLIVNYELESTILQFGEKVEVIQPPRLRAKIIERIRESEKNYKNF